VTKVGEAGQEAEARRPVEAVGDLTGYDAFVVGSAVYAGHWQKEASAFVQRNRTVLASRQSRGFPRVITHFQRGVGGR